jgi:hypothetical protein
MTTARATSPPATRLKAELHARPAEQTATQRRFAGSGVLAHRDSFRFGLDVILNGLDQLHGRSAHSERPA